MGFNYLKIIRKYKLGSFKAWQSMRKLALKPHYPKRFKVTTYSHSKEIIALNVLTRRLSENTNENLAARITPPLIFMAQP